jgi:hypothetical protein
MVRAIKIAGDYTESDNCPAMLAAGGSCMITLHTNAIEYGYQRGWLTIDTNDGNPPQVLRIGGLVTGSFANLDGSGAFGNAPANVTTSESFDLNAGTESTPFNVQSISVSGNPAITETNNCPTPVVDRCTVTINVRPTAVGPITGTLTVVTDAADGTITIPITATPVAEPTTLSANPALLSLTTSGLVLNPLVFTATLRGQGNTPLPGQTVAFSARGTPLCTGVTNAGGIATCSSLGSAGILAMLAGGYTATFAGTPLALPSTATGPLIVIFTLVLF